MGVSLFFAISGFLITTLLLREHEASGTISLSRFYVRRSLRIFALYFAVLGIYCILIYLAPPGPEMARRFYSNLPYFLSYTSNWFVGRSGTFAFAWSLAAEEQFYSTWPSTLRYFRPRRAIWLLATVLAATITWRFLAPLSVRPHNFGLVVLSNVPMAICWGCVVAVVLHNSRSFGLVWRILGWRWAWLVILTLVLVVLGAFPRDDVPVNFLFALLVASCVIREDIVIAPLMHQRLVVHIGVISYGMYLLHGLVYDAADKVGARFGWHVHGVLGFVVILLLTIGVASLSFRYYETPFLRMKSRFEGPRNRSVKALAECAPPQQTTS